LDSIAPYPGPASGGSTPLMPRNTPLVALFVALAASAGVALAAPAVASAATPCWKRLINDWYDGRIDQAYPVRCYRQAIKNLPEDVKAYSSAREDIQRALLAAFRSNDGKPMGPNALVRPRDSRSSSARRGVGDRRSGDDERSAAGGSSDDDSGGPLGAFFEALAPGRADSVPLPLIVLAALAMLLLAAAGAGLVTRRVQARRLPAGPPPEVDPPPPFWPQSPHLRR
jgi:hypothetical protein